MIRSIKLAVIKFLTIWKKIIPEIQKPQNMADYKFLIPHIRRWEGGLSDDSRDTFPAQYPAPCTYTYNGRTSNKWHTNKGIIWLTYSQYATAKGREPKCAEWFEMSDNLWNDIYKTVFWDYWNLDKLPSTAVANIIVKTSWGSGKTGALNMWRTFYNLPNATPIQLTQFIADRIKNKGENFVFNEMWQERFNYFKRLNNPTYERGWLNAWNDFKKINEPLLNKNNRGVGNLIVALIFGGVVYHHINA